MLLHGLHGAQGVDIRGAMELGVGTADGVGGAEGGGRTENRKLITLRVERSQCLQHPYDVWLIIRHGIARNKLHVGISRERRYHARIRADGNLIEDASIFGRPERVRQQRLPAE